MRYQISDIILLCKLVANTHFGAKIWNCIPPSIRNLPKHSFKEKIHNCLLQILSQTNDYFDLPTLLGKMQHIQDHP